MPTNEFLSNEPPEHPLNAQLSKRWRLKTQRQLVLLVFGSLLMLLVASLTACASQPTNPCEPLPRPPKPALSEPLPSVDYSITVRESIKRWENVLTGMSTTSKP